jgi:hypothetical protein
MRVSRLAAVTAVSLTVVLIGVACSTEQAMPLPDCFEGGSGLIVAQSVPSADYVPCTEGLPTGWSKASVEIDQDGTVITFDSDRAGTSAARLHFAEICDVGDAVLVPSDKEETVRFDRPERLEPGFREQRYYVFLGGCVWWEFDFDDGVAASLSIELADRVDLISRVDINEGIRQSFIDEEL